MKPIKKALVIILISCITIFQTGCWDQKIFERIGFILQIGLEVEENGEIRYTAGIPLVSPETQGKTEILSTTITHMREGRDKARQASGKALEGGKTQQVFFSTGLASRGIDEFLEIFLRSPENSLLANVIVVEGSPFDMIKTMETYKDKPRPTFYINSLLESARRNSSAPETRISHFSILTHSGTIDPAVPLMRYNSKEVQIAGAALFSGDKMVGKIDTKEMGLLNALRGEKRDISYIYKGLYTEQPKSGHKHGSTILMRDKKRKVDINVDGGTPVIDIKLEFKGSLNEYGGELDLANQEDKKKLEEAIAESIEKDCMRLLANLVEMGSDPIGFGEVVRTKHNKYWKSVKWKENAYKDATFKVEAKITLEFYGAVTNP
jgi:spore germination protein